MSLDLFRVIKGIDIQSDDISTSAHILQGNGAPGGDGAAQDDAPIGSLYLQTDAASDSLQVYSKWQDTNATADWRQLSTKEYVDTAVQGISWREPVKVLDSTTYANVAAAEAAANVGDQLDGVTIAAGDRVLLTDLPAGGKNVYIVSGTSGNWTLTEDTNDETDGDAVLVNEGTSADAQYIYDGTDWIQFGGAGSATELGFIRDFIGKDSAGNIGTDYPSNDIVIDGQSLEHEIGRLDDAVGSLTFTTPNLLTDYSDALGTEASPGTAATADITTNFQAIDDAFGDGVIAPAGSNYVLDGNLVYNGGTETLTSALDSLNEGIGDRTYTDDNIVTDGQSIAGSIDALDQVIGDIDNSSAYTAGGFLDPTTLAGNDIQETIDSFNQEIGDLGDDTQESTGTAAASPTVTVIDTISATDATEVKWIVQVKDGSGNRRAMEVHALTDGTTVDWNRSSVLRLGNTGSVGLDVVINGGNIELRLEPANALDYTVKRVSKSYLA